VAPTCRSHRRPRSSCRWTSRPAHRLKFHTILAYNYSSAYALAVGHLADRIAGGGPVVASWPRDDMPLTKDERIELQERLADLGYDPGGVDGVVGPKTRTPASISAQ
jgi:membrane-bound lytic murein transglycosylase B